MQRTLHRCNLESVKSLKTIILNKLVGKTPKTDDKQKTREQKLMEALACPCEHPNVIKFLGMPM
jgi:hypothetical protein